MRQKLLTQIQHYHTIFPNESRYKSAFISLIKSNDNCFSRSRLAGHITGSAWILNQNHDKALLTHHRKLNKWLQLGGHADGDENILGVAKKEAFEESGLTNIICIQEEIFDIDIHEIPARKDIANHLHYDIRYLFEANDQQQLLISNESKDLQWIPLQKINHLTNGNSSIMRMVEKSKNIH